MTADDLRDRCCWKRCRSESDMIYMGAGLCDRHWAQACSVFKDTTEYILTRLIPAAAREVEATRRRNMEATP